MKAFILAAALVSLGTAGCGGNQQCETAACPTPSTKSYQICATPGQTVTTETYNGTSCNIDTGSIDGGSPASDPASQACATAIANYCAM